MTDTFLMFKLGRSTLAKRIRARGCVVVVRQGSLSLLLSPMENIGTFKWGRVVGEWLSTDLEGVISIGSEGNCLVGFWSGYELRFGWSHRGEIRWCECFFLMEGREGRWMASSLVEWGVDWAKDASVTPFSLWGEVRVSGDQDGRFRVRVQVRIQVYTAPPCHPRKEIPTVFFYFKLYQCHFWVTFTSVKRILKLQSFWNISWHFFALLYFSNLQ